MTHTFPTPLSTDLYSARKKINQYTLYLTVVLAIVQAYGMSLGLEGLTSSQGAAVHDPGLFFRASTVITIVGGTMFLMWLGEQIRSEEHTSELQSLMRISYAVFCLKKKTSNTTATISINK